MLGNHAESVLSVAEAEITPQTPLVVYEVKEKEIQIAMGGLRVDVLRDETKDLVKRTINPQRGIAHAVEILTKEMTKVDGIN